MNRMCLLILLVLVGLTHRSFGQDSPSASDDDATLVFVRDVRSILEARCYECHSAKKVESGLRLDLRRNAFAGGDQGLAIVPGKPDDSDLLTRITSEGDDRMPPEGPRLTAQQTKTLRDWIRAGASWPEGVDPEDDRFSKHWSWQPLSSPAFPKVHAVEWTQNEVDLFILKKLEENGISPSGIADRHTLIRRAFLDVIGLPPSPEQWRRWMSDPAPEWYAGMIDELLASPHYGERWGRIWLDQARYADSDGYEKDRPRENAYLYRDWVIDALNADLPFDRFSIQQLAGDLLPDATPEVISATGFHRNTLTNREGGIDPEEDRVKQTVDRLNTTFTVWMGLTVQCAQCHTHKYDPISHREYFQLYSFFNDADETEVTLNPSAAQQRAFENALAENEIILQQKQRAFDAVRSRIEAELPELEAALKQRFPSGQPASPKDGLVAHYAFDGDTTTALADSAAANDDSAVARFAGPGEFTLTAGTVGGHSSMGAVSFDGSGQHLELPAVPGFKSDEAFTCSAWIKPTDNLGAILTRINEPNDFRGIDFTNNKGLLEVHLVCKWPDDAIKVTPASARLKADQWQHVLFSYDGSRKAAGVAVYIDGEKVELKVHFDTLTGDFTTPDPWRIGRRKGGTFLRGTVDDVRIYNRVLNDADVALIAGDHQQLVDALAVAETPDANRSPEQKTQLLEYLIAANSEASSLKTELSHLEHNPPKVVRDTAMALRQRNEPRETFVHLRGEFLNRGPQVEIGTPAFLPQLVPRGDRPDRLDLARWMFDDSNSLVARVFVNRIWQVCFGRGLVDTDNDFGTQGNPPTHPELLDWLAEYLVQQQWSRKQLHRKILLSATYQQNSHFRAELQELDPHNTLLAYQRRLRVSAESVRDLALSASGQLDRRIKGPSVFPPLPAGVIELAFVDVINRGPWKESAGGDRYRRGIYTFFQRTSPYPMLSLFDAPDSNVTCTRREKSNTPLQALTVWNDPVFMECARHLALRLITDSKSESGRIENAFVICFSRNPDTTEQAVARRLLERTRQIYSRDPSLADTTAEGLELPEGMTTVEFGAWVSLARALMNLDELITRP